MYWKDAQRLAEHQNLFKPQFFVQSKTTDPNVRTSHYRLRDSSTSMFLKEDACRVILIPHSLKDLQHICNCRESSWKYCGNWIDTECDIIRLAKCRSPQLVCHDDIRYKRIYDRIFETCLPVDVSGESFRKISRSDRPPEDKPLIVFQHLLEICGILPGDLKDFPVLVYHGVGRKPCITVF